MTSIEMLQHAQVNGSETWALEKRVSLVPERTERVLLLAERVLLLTDRVLLLADRVLLVEPVLLVERVLLVEPVLLVIATTFSTLVPKMEKQLQVKGRRTVRIRAERAR